MRRIVVGVDGTDAASRAFDWAVRDARRDGGRVIAVIAWRPAPVLATPGGGPAAGLHTADEQRAEAAATLNRTVRSNEFGDVPIEGVVVHGAAHQVLLAAAAGADLLVIGGHSRRLGALLRWATGQQVVGQARCPVVIVPALR